MGYELQARTGGGGILEKDKNGKTIDLTVNKVARHTFKLKTKNGTQVIDNIGIDISYNSDMTTTYQLNY